MTIASAFNEIAVAQGGTASTSGTIAGAIDALNDALAGSDQPAAQTIEAAVRLLGNHIGGGSSVTVEALTATENKTYTAPEGKAYSPVTVNVPSMAQVADVYVWNNSSADADKIPTSVKYVNDVEEGSPVYASLEIEPVTDSYMGTTVYGVKVKDCPIGAPLTLVPPTGYAIIEFGLGYSETVFPPTGGSSMTYAGYLIDGYFFSGMYKMTQGD